MYLKWHQLKTFKCIIYCTLLCESRQRKQNPIIGTNSIKFTFNSINNPDPDKSLIISRDYRFSIAIVNLAIFVNRGETFPLNQIRFDISASFDYLFCLHSLRFVYFSDDARLIKRWRRSVYMDTEKRIF